MPGSNHKSDKRPDDRTGEQSDCRSIGGFRLLRKIGEGAMSRVFLGYDPAGLRQVAVKLLADHLASNKQFVNRFYREARMSRALVHPNLIHGLAHGYDESARRHYLILEYVDGPNALVLLTQHGPLSVDGVVRIGIEIGKALIYLHGQCYVHRDVKPDNILLCPDGSAKLADLGLAKRLSGDMELTTTNQGVGTPHYMPYEQAVNGDLVDGRSDQFALGATLYHLLTGRVPFAGETHEEIVREKAQDAYQPACHFRPDVPPELDRILARTLSCDPRARYPNASELVADLSSTGLAATGPEWLPPSPTPPTPPGNSIQEGGGATRADLVIQGQSDRLTPKDTPPPSRALTQSNVITSPFGFAPTFVSQCRRFSWPLAIVAIGLGLTSLTRVLPRIQNTPDSVHNFPTPNGSSDVKVLESNPLTRSVAQ